MERANLPDHGQAERCAVMVESLVAELGKEAFDLLSDEEQQVLKLFIWAGCGCHKDLNTVRGGYARMAGWWAENGIDGPVLLANHDNSPVLNEHEAHIAQGDTTTPAQDRAFENTSRGAIKTAQIAGAILNHKDDKKGHHDTFCWWWYENVGVQFTFPSTTNNCFGSNCDASAMLILHRHHFIAFLDCLQENKQSSKFNHMEKNFWKAMHCTATRTELAVIAIYGEAISYPYMKSVRGSGKKKENMLDLGPLHHKVNDHMQKIIADPDILIGSDSSFKTGSLHGEEWRNPDVVKAILHMIPELPYFRELLVAFFTGAADTWARFISEFAPGGLIDEATIEEKDLAWMPATNDVNEGALGQFRVMIRRQPQLTLLGHNAIAMYFRNDTEAFMKEKFTEKEDHQFLHKLARESTGEEKKRKKEIVDF